MRSLIYTEKEGPRAEVNLESGQVVLHLPGVAEAIALSLMFSENAVWTEVKSSCKCQVAESDGRMTMVASDGDVTCELRLSLEKNALVAECALSNAGTEAKSCIPGWSAVLPCQTESQVEVAGEQWDESSRLLDTPMESTVCLKQANDADLCVDALCFEQPDFLDRVILHRPEPEILSIAQCSASQAMLAAGDARHILFRIWK